MGDDDSGTDDRTEEATPERRDEFRERGQVAVSTDMTSVFVLGATVVAFTSGFPRMMSSLRALLTSNFEALSYRRIDTGNILGFLGIVWVDILGLILPAFLVTLTASSVITLLQTRLNWSWERVTPDFSRMNPVSGLGRMFNLRSILEVLKSIVKMLAVGGVAYAILKSQWVKVPGLMDYPMHATWSYWGQITKQLFWTVAGFLLLIASADYLYNFISTEKQMRMTKKEVRDDYKQREVDPHVKSKMRRMQREMATKKTLAKTRKATVLVTNPTHYSIALRYEPGDAAPTVVAKGIDFVALRMREVAKEEKIPIIENRPLARELYATVEEGEEVPTKFYKVIAEIIRYVFKIKGRRIPARNIPAPKPPVVTPPSL